MNADYARSKASVPASEKHSGNVGPIRALLFDKDGTLVDFQRTWGPAVDEVMRHLAHGSRAAYERLAAASRFIEAERRFLPDSPLIGEPTQVFGALWAAALSRAPSAEFFAEIDGLLRDATTSHLAAIGDPKAVLTDLASRSYRIGMITNDPEATARAHVRKLGLDGILEFIAGYDSGFGAKPEPGPVLAFAHALGVAPAEIAMVGDTVLDLIAARAAGALAIGVLTGPASAETLAPHADALIASYTELPAWLLAPPESPSGLKGRHHDIVVRQALRRKNRYIHGERDGRAEEVDGRAVRLSDEGAFLACIHVGQNLSKLGQVAAQRSSVEIATQDQRARRCNRSHDVGNPDGLRSTRRRQRPAVGGGKMGVADLRGRSSCGAATCRMRGSLSALAIRPAFLGPS